MDDEFVRVETFEPWIFILFWIIYTGISHGRSLPLLAPIGDGEYYCRSVLVDYEKKNLIQMILFDPE